MSEYTDFNDGDEEDYLDMEYKEDVYPWPKWYDRFLHPLRFIFCGRERAKKEWLNYYKNLYQTESPSKIIFNNLLKKYGMWNFPNPYREGNENYYAYHENGVFFSDIDFLLSYWKSSVLNKKNEHIEKDNESLSINDKIIKINNNFEQINSLIPNLDFNLSVSYIENFNSVMESVKRKVWFNIAIHNMINLFLDNKNMWYWIKEQIHKENLLLLCKIIYDNAPENEQEKLVSSWTNANWLSSNDARLLTKKTTRSDDEK